MISKLFLNKRIWPFQTANPLVKIFDQVFQRKVLNLVQSERNLYFQDLFPDFKYFLGNLLVFFKSRKNIFVI
jgi:hypothetical protein